MFSNMNILSIFFVILSVVVLINTILLIICMKNIKKYTKQYEKTLSKFNSKKNINDDFQDIYDRINDVELLSQETKERLSNLDSKIKSNVQKIGLVKYNAYDDTENKLSFAVSLLDEYDNGILLNHIYSKHGSNIYAKLVENGKVEERISEEEATALKVGREDKDFKARSQKEIKNAKRDKRK